MVSGVKARLRSVATDLAEVNSTGLRAEFNWAELIWAILVFAR